MSSSSWFVRIEAVQRSRVIGQVLLPVMSIVEFVGSLQEHQELLCATVVVMSMGEER
jgi:hypothetical protein